MRNFSRDFEVDKGVIRYDRKQENVLEARSAATSQSTRENIFLRAELKYPEMQENLVKWLSVCKRMGIGILSSLVGAKAVEMASKLGIMNGSTALNG